MFENKNHIDDVKRLKTAGNTLYILGTGGKSGLGAKINDVSSFIFLTPIYNFRIHIGVLWMS